MKISKIFTLENLLFVSLLSVIGFKAYLWIDPDFPWRLRTGEIITQSGIPRTDVYSYTMPSFPWIDHAWAQDVIFYLVNIHLGKFALAICMAVISVFAVMIPFYGTQINRNLRFGFVNIERLGVFGNSIFLLSLASFVPYIGIRVQLLTWFMLSVFFCFLSGPNLWKKYRLITPFFFLLWANLHGGFAIGLLVFLIYVIVGIYKNGKKMFYDLGIFISSIVATFINPYGPSLYREIWSSVSDSRLRWEIIEWRPAFLSFDIPTLNLVVLFLVFTIRYRNRFLLWEIVVSFVLFLQGLLSVRNLPLFVIVCIPVILRGMSYLYEEITTKGIAKYKSLRIERFQKTSYIFWCYGMVIFALQILFAFRGAVYLSENKFYPKTAVEFLKTQNIGGQVFSEYGWGGYLIANYPEKKVFIDGRMPSWKMDNQNPRETGDAMADYLDITKGDSNYKEYFEKFDIRTVLISKERPKDIFKVIEEKMGDKLDAFSKSLGFEDSDFKLAEALEKDGWRKIYEDGVARIYMPPLAQ